MSVEANLQAIMDARYGKDVRQAIHDSIEEINSVAIQAKGKATTSQDSASAYAAAALQAEQNANAAKQAAQTAAAQAMSSTPEGYADVVAKADSLKDITGATVIVDGTARGGCLLQKMYGVTVQDGVPTPTAPVELKSTEVKLRNDGRNLIYFPHTLHTIADYPFKVTTNGVEFTFNEDGTILCNGTAAGDAAVNINSPYGREYANELIKGRKYRISDGRYGIGRHIDGYVQFVLVNPNNERNWAETSADRGYVDYTYNGTEYDKWGVRVTVKDGATANNVLVKPMVSFYDDTEYVRGGGKTINTDIVLRALEVNSDDNYNLVKDGKYYIADTLEDTENGYEIVRRVMNKKITNIRNIGSLPRFGIVDTTSFNCNDFRLPKTNKEVSKLYSTHFVHTSFDKLALEEQDGIMAINIDNNYLYFKNTNMTSLANWREWIGDNEIIVYGILNKPIREKISVADAKVIYSLFSENTALSILQETEAEGVLEVKYPASEATGYALSGYTQAQADKAKIDELQTALMELEGAQN